ncbi:MAG: plastocyanin/azurin family copper-binding protein [Parvularculaceae bacterium]
MRKLVLGLLLSVLSTSAIAADVVVDMWTLDPSTQERNSFNPGVVMIDKGDTIVWKAQQPGHNVEFLPGAVPEGVDKFRSGFDKEIRYTFDTPGVYAYKCMPHYGLGMIGFVVVGADASNLEAVKAFKFQGMSAGRAKELLAHLDGMMAERFAAKE